MDLLTFEFPSANYTSFAILKTFLSNWKNSQPPWVCAGSRGNTGLSQGENLAEGRPGGTNQQSEKN